MEINALSIHFGDETLVAKWDTPVTMARVDEIYKVIIQFLKANGKEELIGQTDNPEGTGSQGTDDIHETSDNRGFGGC